MSTPFFESEMEAAKFLTQLEKPAQVYAINFLMAIQATLHMGASPMKAEAYPHIHAAALYIAKLFDPSEENGAKRDSEAKAKARADAANAEIESIVSAIVSEEQP